MAGDKYLYVNSGEITEARAIQTSAGASAGNIVSLNSTGKVDESLLPPGVAADIVICVATEVIAQGKYVNLYNDSGTVKARLADNSNNRPAFGWAQVGAANINDNVTVYFEGPNSFLSGLTIGASYWLGTAGGVTATAPVAPAANILQKVGRAVSATSINTDIVQNPVSLIA